MYGVNNITYCYTVMYNSNITVPFATHRNITVLCYNYTVPLNSYTGTVVFAARFDQRCSEQELEQVQSEPGLKLGPRTFG